MSSTNKKKRTFKVGDRVMMVGTIRHIYDGTDIAVRIDGDYPDNTIVLPTALHPHTVRATPEARRKVAKKKARTK